MSTSVNDSVKIICLCLAWYVCSSANNVVGKIILSDFPYPMTVSMVQLLSITIYSLPILKLWNIPSASHLPLKYWFTMIIPLACGKFFASVSSHISIWKVPVSYAHTVKATLPLFTVVLSRIVLGEKHTPRVYMSLLPIIGGVLIATLTEVSFELVGLISALCATLGFSLQNIFSKKCLKDTGIHHMRLLFTLALVCGICFAPLWLLYDFRIIMQDKGFLHSTHTPRIMALLLIDGFCNFSQNLIAFTVIAMLMPLSYAVANATKRIFIIAVSLMTLRNPVTPLNIVGMLIAVCGVLLYNKAKLDQKRERESLPITVKAETNGSLPNGIIGETSYPPSLLLQNTSLYSSMPPSMPTNNYPNIANGWSHSNGQAQHVSNGHSSKHKGESHYRFV